MSGKVLSWVSMGMLGLAAASPAWANARDDEPAGTGAVAASERPVDLVICLDTSGSMKGLIDSAKQKLWAIVNDLALAEPTPRLRVALLTYGNDGHDPTTGWVKIETPLTEDLDVVSQRLFEQTTNGGTELVARVLQAALDQLQFDASPDALKLMFVAGNESAEQDTEVPFRDVCRRAIESGIMVNSIYCGNVADDLAPAWKEVSLLADGHFATIDKDQGTVVIETPFDAELAGLSASLNRTYVPFGEMGLEGCSNQIAQDDNAASLNNAAVAARAVTKGGRLYKVNWDLATACQEQRVKLEEVKDEDLPEEMRAMTQEQRAAHLEQKLAERARVQEQINALNVKRSEFLAVEMQRRSNEDQLAFDRAVRQAVRDQAGSRGFRFAPLPEMPLPTGAAVSPSIDMAPGAPSQQVIPAPQLDLPPQQNAVPRRARNGTPAQPATPPESARPQQDVAPPAKGGGAQDAPSQSPPAEPKEQSGEGGGN